MSEETSKKKVAHGPSERCDDRSTWRLDREGIELPALLKMIERKGHSAMNLHGAVLSPDASGEPLDCSPQILKTYMDAYVSERGSLPPWAGAGITLQEAHLERAQLIEARLPNANLNGAHLEHASLWRAHLEGASLHSAHLQHAQLENAHLEHAILRFAHLENAVLWGAHLDDADLRKTRLQDVDLYDVASLAGVRWYGAFLDRTRMNRHQLGSAIGDETWAQSEKRAEAYLEAAEAYLLLKNNFVTLGRYGDVGWAYIKERQMAKMAYHWGWRWRFWRAWPAFGRWLRNWAYEALTGYGERPLQLVEAAIRGNRMSRF